MTKCLGYVVVKQGFFDLAWHKKTMIKTSTMI